MAKYKKPTPELVEKSKARKGHKSHYEKIWQPIRENSGH